MSGTFQELTQDDLIIIRKRIRRLLIMMVVVLILPMAFLMFALIESALDAFSIIFSLFLLLPFVFIVWRIRQSYWDIKEGRVFVLQGRIEQSTINPEVGGQLYVNGYGFSPFPLEKRKDSTPLSVGTYVTVEILIHSQFVLRIRSS